MGRAVEALLTSHPGLALRLLSTAPDAALGEMFADRRFVQKVDAAIPPADRQPFYEERFGASREEAEAGAARPRAMYPAGFFNPGMLSPDLADLPVSAEVTPEQARAALYGRGEAELARALAGLSPPEMARAAWWIVRARETAGWRHQALVYLTGDWAVRLTARQQRELVVALVTGRPSPNEVWLALQLLRAAHDDDLRVIVDPGGELLAMLEEAIPADDSLREELETFLRQRFGGRDELAAGRWAPRGQPPGLFIPALLDNSLRGVAPDVEPGGATLDLIEAAISRLGRQKLTAMLMKLPLVERARAARWLTAVRVALHARGTSRPEVMATIDQTRDVLYRTAARDVPDADRLSQVTRTPPAEQIGALRRVLDPAPDTAGGQAQPFTRRVPGQEKDFADRLAEAFDRTIEFYTSRSVDNRRAEDRVPGNLRSMEDMRRIVADAQKRIDKTFGHLKLVKGWDGIRIHDQWEYADQQIKDMSDAARRELARSELMKYLTWPNIVADVMREHHAAPRFDDRRSPGKENEEARIIRAVIEGLLDREGTEARVLDIYRGSPARARSATREMWFQFFRPREPRQRQQAEWEQEITAIHENLHLLEHSRFMAYRRSLGLGSQADNTLGEGSVTLFTENVWPGVRLRRTVRMAVEGELANEPPLPPDQMPHPGQPKYRYRSIEQIMRLVHMVGDIRNLYAAFFLGEVEKIAGPISLAVMGSPEAPLPAGEVAALVARLNALPPGERERLRISLITDASPPEITRLLTGPAAEVIGVWAVASRYVAAEENEPGRRVIAWNGEPHPGASGRRPRLGSQASDEAWLENAWAVGRQQLSELAARLTGDTAAGRPDADVGAVPEALARYARARLDRTAAVEALAEFRGSPDGSSSPLPREQRLVADVRRAQGELTEAHDGLVAVGVADPGRAWRKVARLLARLAGGGLPGGGPRRSGRSEEQRGRHPSGQREQPKRRRSADSPPVPVRRPRLASSPQAEAPAVAEGVVEPAEGVGSAARLEGQPGEAHDRPAEAEVTRREAERAAERVARYLGGDLGTGLDEVAGQRAVLFSLLAGSRVAGAGWRRVALLLLAVADDWLLGQLFGDGGELLAALLAAIPVGDPLLGELDELLDRRVAGGWRALAAGTAAPSGQPPEVFSPEFLFDSLASVGAGPERTLSEEDVEEVIEEMAMADVEAMVGQFRRLPVVQRARGGRWLGGALAQIHSRLVAAQSAAAGEAPGDVEQEDLETMRAALRTLEEFLNWVYLDSAAQIPDATAVVFALGGGVEVTQGHLDGLARLRAGLAAESRAARRAAEQAAERVARYLGGDLGTGLDEMAQQRAVLWSLLAGPGVEGGGWRRVALALLRAADDQMLRELFGDGGELLVVLLAAIPAGDPLRGELDELFDRRVAGGWRALAAGTAAPAGQPPEVFSPEFLSDDLAGVGAGPDWTLSEEDVGEVIVVMALADLREMTEQLGLLPVVQRARAGRWLLSARVRIHSRLVAAESAAAARETPDNVEEEALATMRAALRNTEVVLNWLYLDAAAQVSDAAALSQRAAVPSAGKVPALRAALDPATEVIPAGSSPVEQTPLPGSRAQDRPAEDAPPAWETAFRAALHTEYGKVIARLWETSVRGRGPAERLARGLHSMERVGQVAQEVKWWFDRAFGQLVTVPAAVPDRPGQPGNIHDQFEYADERINAMAESESLEQAASEMRAWLYGAEPLAQVLAAYRVNPVFGHQGVPPNQHARMVNAVIEDILGEPGKVRQVLEIWRGWPGYEKTATGEVFIQTIRAATVQGNQVFWWAHTWTQFHETAHRLQHPELLRYAVAVGGAGENTLIEGLACWVSELAAAPMMPHIRERWLRERIEGEYASAPPLDPAAMPSIAPGKRYPSYTEVMKLLHVVGNPHNVLMAFFFGRVELITGPIGVALMGSPEAPLPAGEVAAVVLRLGALSPAERHGLRVSVYTEAPQQMIEDLLTKQGAEVLTVWTAARPGLLREP